MLGGEDMPGHMPGYKACSKCKEVKIAVTNFWKDPTKRNGFTSWCKACSIKCAERRRLEGPILVQERNCSICKQCKPADAFMKDSRRITGLDARCRECRRAQHQARKQRNIAAGAPRWTEKECKCCHVVKPAELFKKHAYTASGLDSWCKACCSNRRKELLAQKALEHLHGPITPVDSKECVQCSQVKAAADFGKDLGQPSGLTRRCKACEKDIRATLLKKRQASDEEEQEEEDVSAGLLHKAIRRGPGRPKRTPVEEEEVEEGRAGVKLQRRVCGRRAKVEDDDGDEDEAVYIAKPSRTRAAATEALPPTRPRSARLSLKPRRPLIQDEEEEDEEEEEDKGQEFLEPWELAPRGSTSPSLASKAESRGLSKVAAVESKGRSKAATAVQSRGWSKAAAAARGGPKAMAPEAAMVYIKQEDVYEEAQEGVYQAVYQQQAGEEGYEAEQEEADEEAGEEADEEADEEAGEEVDEEEYEEGYDGAPAPNYVWFMPPTHPFAAPSHPYAPMYGMGMPPAAHPYAPMYGGVPPSQPYAPVWFVPPNQGCQYMPMDASCYV